MKVHERTGSHDRVSQTAILKVSLDSRFGAPEIEWVITRRMEHRHVDEVFHTRILCRIDERPMPEVIDKLARLVPSSQNRMSGRHHCASAPHRELQSLDVGKVAAYRLGAERFEIV